MPLHSRYVYHLILVASFAATAILADALPSSSADKKMNEVAESYVKLVLALGNYDADYVDAYYGPAAWQAAVKASPPSLDQIREQERALRTILAAPGIAGPGEMNELRHQYLDRQLSAMDARIDMLQGRKFSFDEESQKLYDATAPTNSEDHFREVLAKIDRALPGGGPLPERWEAYRKNFFIPRDKLDAVFRAAIAECRARTARYIALPAGENFTVEYVQGTPWGAYNWYKGNYQSLIQVNTDLPITIDRSIDLACHEGYPGHHVYNSLLEKHLVHDRGWVEFTVYPLFSPQSLIAEGSGNYGIKVAFPGDEKTAFERDVLYPLAGLDPTRAAEYNRIQALLKELAYARNEAARRYLNGEITAAAAAAWITRFTLIEPAQAAKGVRFIDRYRSYVVNYNLGEDLVKQFVESRTGGDQGRRWEVFAELNSSPRLPSMLK
jgi:hypothetical protein